MPFVFAAQATDVFDRHLHTRELQGVFSSLAELFFQVRSEDPTQLSCIMHTSHVCKTGSSQSYNTSPIFIQVTPEESMSLGQISFRAFLL